MTAPLDHQKVFLANIESIQGMLKFYKENYVEVGCTTADTTIESILLILKPVYVNDAAKVLKWRSVTRNVV